MEWLFHEPHAANRPRSKRFMGSKKLLLPPPSSLLQRCSCSWIARHFYAVSSAAPSIQVHGRLLTGGAPVPISCWAPNNEARRVDGETRWHASSGCSCLFAEVEAQRSGPAAHGQRPVSGQPDTRRTPGHCSVSPPGGRTVLGAADHQLMHGWLRLGTGACRRTQGNTSAHWGLKKQKKEGEPFVNSSHSSLAVKKKPHTSLRRWGARTCKIFFVCTELHPCRLLQFFYLIWDFHREKNKPNNNSCISHCQFISVFSVLLIGSL